MYDTSACEEVLPVGHPQVVDIPIVLLNTNLRDAIEGVVAPRKREQAVPCRRIDRGRQALRNPSNRSLERDAVPHSDFVECTPQVPRKDLRGPNRERLKDTGDGSCGDLHVAPVHRVLGPREFLHLDRVGADCLQQSISVGAGCDLYPVDALRVAYPREDIEPPKT